MDTRLGETYPGHEVSLVFVRGLAPTPSPNGSTGCRVGCRAARCLPCCRPRRCWTSAGRAPRSATARRSPRSPRVDTRPPDHRAAPGRRVRPGVARYFPLHRPAGAADARVLGRRCERRAAVTRRRWLVGAAPLRRLPSYPDVRVGLERVARTARRRRLLWRKADADRRGVRSHGASGSMPRRRGAGSHWCEGCGGLLTMRGRRCRMCRTGCPTRRARAGPCPRAMSVEHAYEELVTRLRKHWVRADERCEDLRREPGAAGEFARSPYGQPARLFDAPAASKAGRR
jgi:hypothetical protein